MNNTYKEIWEGIISNNKVTILTHKNPDGDTIGSAVALKHLILENTSNIEVKISGDVAPANLEFIDETEEVSDEFFNESQVVVVDTSTLGRVFDKRIVQKEAIKIDHHHHEGEWKLEIGGDDWAANGEHIYNFIKELGLKYNQKVLDATFVSIWTDTSGMKYRTITDNTKVAFDFVSKRKDELLQSMILSKDKQEIVDRSVERMNVVDNVTELFIEDYNVDNDLYRVVIDECLDKLETELFLVCVKQSNGTFRASIRSKCFCVCQTMRRWRPLLICRV